MSDPLQEAVVWVGNNEPVVLTAAGIAVGLYILLEKLDKRAFKDFKPKALEDRVIPDLKYRINTLGKDCDKDLKHGEFNKIGAIHKYHDMEYADNKKITIRQKSKEEKQEDVAVEEVRAYMMTPQQRLRKIIWYITDILFGSDNNTKILVAYKDLVEEDYDSHKIPDKAQFKNKGGVLVQKGVATDNVINDIAKQDAEDAVWEGIPNYVEKINSLMPQHSQKKEIEKVRKEDSDELL